MDLWVVAAAAGAGYIAKNLQNLSSVDKKESSSEPSFKYSVNVLSSSKRNVLQQLRDKTCPLRKLAQNRANGDDFLDVENHSDVNNCTDIDRLSNRDLETGVASSSGDALERNGIHEYYNLGSVSGPPSGFNTEEKLMFEDGEIRKLIRISRGKLSRARKRREHLTRPLSSVGSCLDARLCKDHGRSLEEGMCSLVPSIAMLRPMLVSDGNRIISRSSSDSSFVLFESCREEVIRETVVCSKANNTTSRPATSEQFEPVEELQMNREKCSVGASGGSLHSQGPNGILLFIMGMTIGILSATMSSKKDVDELNRQLKQTQNLVQDLHEELDMKEMLTVKELINEAYLPPRENDMPQTIQEPNASPSYVNDNAIIYDGSTANDKTTENPELMSKIEAELQAELEMLEQNMKASAPERISSFLELDPGFEPDIALGDLKPLMANNDESESGNEATDTTTNFSQPANYAVCPWELSVRLHELIEFRLEERIKELEIALDNSQNRVRLLGSQSIDVGKRSYYNGTEFLSTPPNPTCILQYDTPEDTYPMTNISSNHRDSYKKPNGSLQEGEDYSIFTGDEELDPMSHLTMFMEEDKSSDLVHDMPQILDTETWTSFMSNEDCRSEDDGTDESEMLLIKQIVERRKSGSNFALKF